MANNVTLSQLRSDARLYADQRPGGSSAFITDTELTRLVNLALRELYDLLLSARGHEYYIDDKELYLTSGTSIYSLPCAFYQLLSVTLEWSDDEHELVDAINNVRDRHHYTNFGEWTRWAPKGYRVRGGKIEFLPTPSNSVTCRLQYIPAFEDLSNDADTFDGVNGWEKLVALKTAIEMRIIEETPVGGLEQLYQAERARIEALAADRDAGVTRQVTNVYPEGRVYAWPRHGTRVE